MTTTRTITDAKELDALAEMLNTIVGGKAAATETSWTREGSLYLIRESDEVVWVPAEFRKSR